MNTEKTAQQLELAAQLIRTGHPFEFSEDHFHWFKTGNDPLYHIKREDEIRPVLATPPDGRPLHNPDNLDAEKVGVGYRLLCAEDGVPSGKVDTWMFGGWCSSYAVDKKHLHECDKTYRIPLSVPWPEAKPDPYAELKKAHAEGKKMEYFDGAHWNPIDSPSWICSPNRYRIKPEPAFPTPATSSGHAVA